MSTRLTTTPAERIDLLLAQAHRFYELDLVGEAITRTRHVLTKVDAELRGTTDLRDRRDLETRRTYAIHLLQRLGGKPFPAPPVHAAY
jgi:hypothetical protein